MSTPKRTEYFRRRRLRLRRRHLCTRCGTDRPAEGKKLCPACLGVNVAKKCAHVSPGKAREEKRKRLLARLDLIEAGRLAVLNELDALA